MVTQVRNDSAIAEFAERIGEWLLKQRFGSIEPLAFRWRMWEPGPDYGDAEPHVVIELVVTDPPVPVGDDPAHSWDQWAKSLLWPQSEMDEVRACAVQYAREIKIPHGVSPRWPVDVHFFGRSEAEGCGFAPIDD